MILKKLKNSNNIFIFSTVFFVFIFIFFLSILLLLIYTFYKDNKNFLNTIADRIQFDLLYKDGRWDTTLYNSDPLTPYPNSSGSSPVYIITKDGYVIERSKPINGFLDTADFKHLVQFTEPTNLGTLTNEKWRVYSKEIKAGEIVLGVVMVAYNNPEENIINDIDSKLISNLDKIVAQIELNNNQIGIDSLDIRKIDFNISFEIVTKTNKMILSNGRIPTFIDPSYVENELKSLDIRTVKDELSGEYFKILAKPLLTEDREDIGGIIVVARSVDFENKIVFNYIKFSVFLAVLLVIAFTGVIVKIFNYFLELKIMLGIANIEKLEPKTIIFNHKESFLQINEIKFKIAYASNQYYLLKSIFSKPDKLWENDELIEKFGENFEENSQKKVYDTSLAINKKIGIKLILYKDKTYTVNSQYKEIIIYT